MLQILHLLGMASFPQKTILSYGLMSIFSGTSDIGIFWLRWGSVNWIRIERNVLAYLLRFFLLIASVMELLVDCIGAVKFDIFMTSTGMFGNTGIFKFSAD